MFGILYKYFKINVICNQCNLIGSSLILKCNPTNTEGVEKALNQGRFEIRATFLGSACAITRIQRMFLKTDK